VQRQFFISGFLRDAAGDEGEQQTGGVAEIAKSVCK
jgi:hypothetical protein